MPRTYTFVFQPEPEGGFTVTCPALPGLVTHGETLASARAMAQEAMDGLLQVMTEVGTPIPDSDNPDALPRFSHLAVRLQDESQPRPIFEQLTARLPEPV